MVSHCIAFRSANKNLVLFYTDFYVNNLQSNQLNGRSFAPQQSSDKNMSMEKHYRESAGCLHPLAFIDGFSIV